MRPFSWENSYNPFVISQWVYYWMLMSRIIKNSWEHVFKYISTAEFSPTKFPKNDVAKGNGFRRVLVTVKSQKSAKRWLHSKALRVFMHAPRQLSQFRKHWWQMFLGKVAFITLALLYKNKISFSWFVRFTVHWP